MLVSISVVSRTLSTDPMSSTLMSVGCNPFERISSLAWSLCAAFNSRGCNVLNLGGTWPGKEMAQYKWGWRVLLAEYCEVGHKSTHVVIMWSISYFRQIPGVFSAIDWNKAESSRTEKTLWQSEICSVLKRNARKPQRHPPEEPLATWRVLCHW